MSAITAPAPVDLDVPIRHRNYAVASPAAYPYPPLGAPHAHRKKTRAANLAASVMLGVMSMTAVAGITYIAGGFVGNVALDSASREASVSRVRAATARGEEHNLRGLIANDVSDESIQRWASFNNFEPPYKLAAGKTPSKR